MNAMQSISHEDQRRIWDQEHRTPTLLKQMDSTEASSGVVKFLEFLKAQWSHLGTGLEMGCGKGRSVIWLAQNGADEMFGFDFSPYAIEEAKRRATQSGADNAHFSVQDATTPWSYESGSFDFGIDCFATTDIETPTGRAFAVKEMHRVLKPGAFMLVYLLSWDDEYHNEVFKKHPGNEKYSFVHPKTGKFEKCFDDAEIRELYRDFSLVSQIEMVKRTEFFDKQYEARNLWTVFRK